MGKMRLSRGVAMVIIGLRDAFAVELVEWPRRVEWFLHVLSNVGCGKVMSGLVKAVSAAPTKSDRGQVAPPLPPMLNVSVRSRGSQGLG